MYDSSTKVSRRQFLKNVLAPAAMIGVYPQSLLATVNTPENPPEFALHFTNITGLGPELGTDTILQHFVPLHREQALPDSALSPQEQVMVRRALQETFKQDGLAWDEAYEIGFSYQHYGVPHRSRELDEMVDYCSASIDFIKSHFSGLFTPNVSWGLLEDGMADESISFNGYIGRFTYYVVKAFVRNLPESSDAPYLVQAQPIERAINYIEDGQHHNPNSGTIFLVPGISSMVSPFSEFVHLTFHQGSRHYSDKIKDKVGPLRARQYARNITESLVESLSFSMVKQFMHEIGHDEKLPTIQYMADNLADKFTYMPQITKQIRHQGIQNVIDFAHESPLDFFGRIEQI